MNCCYGWPLTSVSNCSSLSPGSSDTPEVECTQLSEPVSLFPFCEAIAHTFTTMSGTTEDNPAASKKSPNLPPKPIRTVQCNQMSYRDGDGCERSIYLAKGTLETACKLLMEENWAELAKYPIWGMLLLVTCLSEC